MSGRTRGFSLVELLVVTAIIGVIMGMMLPAIQKVRESASRTVCGNRLHQVGLAFHLYVDQCGTLPSKLDKSIWWWGQLSPYLENNIGVMGATAPAWYTGLACDWGVRPEFACPTRAGHGSSRIDYAGAMYTYKGAIYAGHWNEVGDGLSNTLLLAEKNSIVASPTGPYPVGMAVADCFQVDANCIMGAMVDVSGISPPADYCVPDSAITFTTTSVPLNPGDSWAPEYGVDANCSAYWANNTNAPGLTPQSVTIIERAPLVPMGFGSAHPGSLNVLMCDSSVHRLTYSTPGLLALVNMNDNAGSLP